MKTLDNYILHGIVSVMPNSHLPEKPEREKIKNKKKIKKRKFL
jgi:hypothetical protein